MFLLIQVMCCVSVNALLIMLATQAILGRISLHTNEYKSGESSALLDSTLVFRHANRIARGKMYSLRSDIYSSTLQQWLRLR